MHVFRHRVGKDVVYVTVFIELVLAFVLGLG